MGWGGRLVGFLATTAKEYVGTDVNKENVMAYLSIFETYCPDKSKYVSLATMPAEEFKPPLYENYFDFSFSSPPYFNKEEYSVDPNQSYLKYPKFEDWCEGFLKPMINNNFYMIRHGGHFGINVADIKIGSKLYPILSYTKKYSEEAGFIQESEFTFDTYRTHESNAKKIPEVLVVYRKE
jgi:tRNA1(Val) A37 N6-methylase TrmN6